jgi:hypothetical protein
MPNGRVPEVLRLEEADPAQGEIEILLRGIPEGDLRALHARTRMAAVLARHAEDMAELIRLVRGNKTLQRIAGERGIVIAARPMRAGRPGRVTGTAPVMRKAAATRTD